MNNPVHHTVIRLGQCEDDPRVVMLTVACESAEAAEQVALYLNHMIETGNLLYQQADTEQITEH